MNDYCLLGFRDEGQNLCHPNSWGMKKNSIQNRTRTYKMCLARSAKVLKVEVSSNLNNHTNIKS